MCCQTCMRGTLQQSSIQQQLQQHPSWEAANGSRAPDLGPFEVFSCNSGDQLGDRPSSLVPSFFSSSTPAEPRVMSVRMPLQEE